MSIPHTTTTKNTGRPRVNPVVLLLLLATAAVGIIAWISSSQKPAEIPHEKGVVYYTGPKFNIRTGQWVDANGHITAPPPGEPEHPPLPKDARSATE
jgi:hypothetical protein